MKKLLTIAFCGAALFFGFSGSAQSQGDFRASLGLAMGTKASVDTDTGDDKLGIGLDLGVEYFVIDKLSLAPSYTYFFPADLGSGVKYNTANLNFDARYYLADQFYAMAGYTSFSSKLSGGGGNISVSEGAWNIGAGAMLPMNDNMGINLQLKYQSILDSAIDFDQIVGQVGVSMSF